MADRKDIEAAIKLLQGSGYDVFQRVARLKLHAVRKFPAAQIARYASDPAFERSVRRDLMHLLAASQEMADCATFSRHPTPSHNGYDTDIDEVAQVDFYPVARREWGR